MKNYTFFDAHCHFSSYTGAQLDSFVKAAKKMGVCIFFMSEDIESYIKLKSLLNGADNAVPCFGIHPDNAYKYANSLSCLDEYIKDAKVIGEIGLDNKWSDKSKRRFQKSVFEYQLEAALFYNKPISVHTTGAEAETYEILKNHNCQNVCIHWCHDLKTLQSFISLGCFFSVGPDVETSQIQKQIAKTIPQDKLLCETDGPAAVAWAKNMALCDQHFSPKAIIDVYENLAKTINVGSDMLVKKIKQNIFDFLKTPKK